MTAPTVPSIASGHPHVPPTPLPRWVEAVVIGSGMGGLTAAALLARHGVSVAVLEQQGTIGGCLSAFRHEGYTFDVGLHYVSNWDADGVFPRVLRAIGATEPIVRALDPDGFDTLCFPDWTFRVPSNVELYRERLLGLFPGEVRGIDRYVRALGEVHALATLALGQPRLAQLWRARGALRYTSVTLAAFLDACTRDPRLQAVLAAQNGIYGSPPSRAAAVEHLMAVSSYMMSGAYYPAGGSSALADVLVDAIERHGGRIHTGARVNRILVKHGRAQGVTYHLDGEPDERAVQARVVISDADIKHTLLDMVDPQHVKASTVRRVRNYEMAAALGAVYLGVKRDLAAEGVPVTNFWVLPSYDLDRVYTEAWAGRFDPTPGCFVSLTSLKDPWNESLAPPGITNLQVIGIAPSGPGSWGTTVQEFLSGAASENARYVEIRAAFADRLVRSAERALPGLATQVVHRELATPLTHWKYTGATNGTPYGIAQIPSQSLSHRPGTKTEIDNLYLCGASTRFGGGLLPTMLSGVHAGAAVLGPQVIAEVTEADQPLGVAR